MEVLALGADDTRTTLYLRGFNDGVAARDHVKSLTPYLRVGIDDYAQGYRSGFYSQCGGVGESRESARKNG